MSYNLLFKFKDKKDASIYKKEASKIDNEYNGELIDNYFKPREDVFKDFLYIIWSIVIIVWVIWMFIYLFMLKPDPVTVVDTQYITGNTYQVNIEWKKFQTIGSLVYYYDTELNVLSWAKLTSINLLEDWKTQYNICRQFPETDEHCLDRVEDKDNCDEGWCATKCELYDKTYSDCFTTSIVWATEAELNSSICNK